MPLHFGPSIEQFPELKLKPGPANRILVFNIAPMQSLLERNGLSPDTVHQLSQESLRELLLVWYIEHTSRGGHCGYEIRAAVRDLLDPNPATHLELRPAFLSSAPTATSGSQTPEKRSLPEVLSTRVRHALESFGTYFLGGGEGVIPAEYKVPEGPAIHMRPRARNHA